MPDINTLIPDIYHLFDPDVEHTVNEEYIEEFGENLKALLRERLRGRKETGDAIRFSSLGKQDRQIWLSSRNTPGEKLTGKVLFKFVYGDVLEQLILFLAKEAGHEVTHEQHEVEVDGVKGHLDAVIDGHVVDAKSASPYGFQKFKNETLADDDAFGYIPQLSGYATEVTPNGPDPYFFAINKVDGDLCLMRLPEYIVKENPPKERIAHLKDVLASDNPPPICYEPVPDGKSGNMKLATGCSYCAFKKTCWPEVRTFLYSNGPRFLVKVEREPDVYEVKD